VEIKGILKVVNPTVQVSEKFTKRDFVITTTEDMYPQEILMQLTKDSCSLLDGMNVGDTVNVAFNLRGKEWCSPQGEVKYFNTLEAWKIMRINGNQNQGGQQNNGGNPFK